jgi:TPR repeat protein
MGTEAKVRAAAELFGAGTSGQSESAKSSRNKDGEPGDCSKSAPDSDKPPSQCGAPIRLVLAPIKAAPAEGQPAPEPKPQPAAVAEAEVACPTGLVLAEGKCTSPASAPAFQCDPGNAAECTAQCDKGHAGSCGSLGAIALRERDVAKATPLLKKACDGDDAKSCVNLGIVTQDQAAAVKLFEKGCTSGVALGCEKLGRAYLAGTGGLTADATKALAHLRQGCEGGQDTACAGAADILAAGKAGAADVKGAMELHKRACDGSVAASCTELGRLHEISNQGIVAEMLYRRGCYRGSADACFHLGRFELARSPEAAKRDFDMACMRQSKLGCAALVVLYGEKRPVFPDVAQKQELSRSCIAGNTRDCMLSGLFDAAQNNPMAKMPLDRACMRGDKFACEIAKKLAK